MKKAILVVIDTGFLKDESYITECKELCKAANYSVETVLIQRARNLDPQTALRKGKLEEVQATLQTDDYQALIFYNRLSFAMLRGLTEKIDVDVIDRSHLILNIFSLRARSKEAQLQIEMARLRYALPTHLWEKGAEDQVGGGSLHNKGSGETRSALKVRQNRARLAELAYELRSMKRRNQEKKNKRQKSGLKKVALVGYTNAGKSTILNAFVKDEKRKVYAEDQLFATLDTTTRRIKVGQYEFFLFDTVGFVSDLPSELIEAFHSTLSCVTEADLLLHVVDISNPHWLLQKEVTEETLRRIGAQDIPRMLVFNKADACINNEIKGISAYSQKDIEQLGEKIVARLYPQEKKICVFVPYQVLGLVENYRSLLAVNILQEKEEGVVYQISGPEEMVIMFQNQTGAKDVEG